MKTNEVLQKDVQDAIKWEPLLNAAEIGVTAIDGVVTLTGNVDSYAKKMEAEEAVKKVVGVLAVVEKIQIKMNNWNSNDDSEIAKELVEAYNSSWQVPHEKITVKVENGWITLGGEVDWNHQKEAAKKIASNMPHIKWVTNNITIKSQNEDAVEKEAIESAMLRNSILDDRAITVEVTGTTVTLTGSVHSWYQKNEANRVAWNAPGVLVVNDQLKIDYV